MPRTLSSPVIELDATGFPLIGFPEWPFLISLWPVGKWQFERFMIDGAGPRSRFTESWYRERLALNSRRSAWDPGDQPWRLFMSGVNASEVEEYCAFLGRGFGLPTATQWRALYDKARVFAATFSVSIRTEIRRQSSAQARRHPVHSWLNKLPFPLVTEGVWEMVSHQGSVRYVGRPFADWHPNLYVPDDLRDLDWAQSQQYIGFRVVKQRGPN